MLSSPCERRFIEPLARPYTALQNIHATNITPPSSASLASQADAVPICSPLSWVGVTCVYVHLSLRLSILPHETLMIAPPPLDTSPVHRVWLRSTRTIAPTVH